MASDAQAGGYSSSWEFSLPSALPTTDKTGKKPKQQAQPFLHLSPTLQQVRRGQGHRVYLLPLSPPAAVSAAGLQESTSHRRGEGEQGEGEQGEGEGVQPLQWSFLTAGEGLRAVSSLNSPSQGIPSGRWGFLFSPLRKLWTFC